MLQSNARIYNNNKIKFFEQDIVLDDYVFSSSIECEINAEYINPGLGIALISNECLYLNEKKDIYIAKIGYNECSILRSVDNKTKKLEKKLMQNKNPRLDNVKLKLCYDQDYNLISLYVDDELMLKKTLPTRLDYFFIGYYSNKDNVIKSIDISAKTPDNWFLNMKNSNGGYIEFEDNGYKLYNCSDKVEFEQYNIKLSSGDQDEKLYYLGYELSQDSDIKPYVFRYNNGDYVDSRKSILQEDNSFIVRGEENLNIKFVGTKGTVKNVFISKFANDSYVPTSSEDYENSKSSIIIDIKNVSIIELKATITALPLEKDESIAAVIEDANSIYDIDSFGISLGACFDMKIDLENNIILIDQKAYNVTLSPSDNKITLLNNMNAVVEKLTITKKDGSQIDEINQDINTIYVPGTITSPIIVTLNNKTPLDLSSSVELVDGSYRFTNRQRETMKPRIKMKLSSSVLNNIGSITVYGVALDSQIYEDRINEKISDYCNIYEDITDQIQSINYKSGLITMKGKMDNLYTSKYKEIVADYTKDNSYCINFDTELNSYKVDIACNENTDMYYDASNKYRVIESQIPNDSYVIIR